MATNANWTIVFEDKCIIKNHAEGASEGIGYVIDDDSFCFRFIIFTSCSLDLCRVSMCLAATGDKLLFESGSLTIWFAISLRNSLASFLSPLMFSSASLTKSSTSLAIYPSFFKVSVFSSKLI